MATEGDVLRAVSSVHPDSGVIVVDGRSVPFKKLAERPATNGGGLVLVVLDCDPDALGVVPATVAL
jgi:hypothetical protein